jgi:cellulose synthase/poly-beta-1,6-N-acetylglucosamine synthase-like glycosyltransferase
MIAAVFWVAIGLIVYTYLIYPVLLIAASGLKQAAADIRFVIGGRSRRTPAARAPLPSVAVLVAAHNEQRHIVERLRNLLQQDYPAELLRVYIGSDGSTDRTDALVRENADPRIVFRAFETNRGKPSVVNDLAAMAGEDLLVFTDANTFFEPDTVSRLVRHFADERIGCVCGELRLVAAAGGENPDNLYWRYERVLKFFEARLGALLGANGGVYAMRRTHYRPIAPDTIVDDFSISVDMIVRGYRCAYDPEAIATEEIPPLIHDEFRRRVRIGIGNYQAWRRHAALMDPRRGAVAFAFVSHKCLRWIVPHCMVLALATNALLAPTSPLYLGLLAGQAAFYAAALGGHWLSRRRRITGLLRLPTFFVGMNLALLVGFYRYAAGGYSGSWARSAR